VTGALKPPRVWSAGPKEGAADVAWHPRRSAMASLCDSGAILLWALERVRARLPGAARQRGAPRALRSVPAVTSSSERGHGGNERSCCPLRQAAAGLQVLPAR